jgi:hypothetical protein
MAFLERFLPKAKKGDGAPSPESAIGALQTALAKIREEREAADRKIGAHAAKRRALLLEDAATETILSHDLESDRARVNQDRLDEAEGKIREMIAFEEDVVADGDWRGFYDQWHALALACLETIQAAHGAQQQFLAHHESAPGGYSRGLQIGRVPVVNPGGLLQLGEIHAKETRRREAMDAVIAQRRAEAAL